MHQVIVRLASTANEFIKLQSDKQHDLHLATSVLLRCGMITGMYVDEHAIKHMGFEPNVIDSRFVDFSDDVKEWSEENDNYEDEDEDFE